MSRGHFQATISPVLSLHSYPLHYDTLLVSDVHLGKKRAQARELLHFLQNVDRTSCKRLIIDGDFLDFWKMARKKVWQLPEIQIRLIDEINSMVRDGVEVIYVPGNHDELLRQPKILGRMFFGIKIVPEYVFQTQAGHRVHVSHGDEHDGDYVLYSRSRLIHDLADRLNLMGPYDFLQDKLNGLKSLFGRAEKRFSLSKFLKTLKKIAPAWFLQAQDRLEKSVVRHMKGRGFDFFIRGHSHIPKDNPPYLNSGDWSPDNHCTFIACSGQDRPKLFHWYPLKQELAEKGVLRPLDLRQTDVSIRRTTLMQLRLLRSLCPGRELEKERIRFVRQRLKMAAYEARALAYREIAGSLENKSFKEQGKKLKGCFNRYARLGAVHKAAGHDFLANGYTRVAQMCRDELAALHDKGRKTKPSALVAVFRQHARDWKIRACSQRDEVRALRAAMQPWLPESYVAGVGQIRLKEGPNIRMAA